MARIVVLIVVWLLPCAAGAEVDAEAAPSELADLLGSDDARGYARAIEPRPFEFPADHGPHPDFRNEWWYFTGNLESADGSRFGYELTVFRIALTPEPPEADSDWRTNQVFFAHFALTDAAGERFFASERFSRGAAGLAGAQAEPFRVWIDDWEVAAANERASTWRLSAAADGFAVRLELEPVKPPVLNGIDGLSRKSAAPGQASYYYSMTRWTARGRVRVGDEDYDVAGTSWMDREWSTSALAPEQAGWDWFALQLDDGSDLMYYQLRRTDGSRDPHSAGTWVADDGSARHLEAGDVSIEVAGRWTSPDGGVYPSGWRLRVPRLDLELDVEPVIPDQELDTVVRYWEGAVDIRGSRSGRPVAGRGYVELTGYAADAGPKR